MDDQCNFASADAQPRAEPTEAQQVCYETYAALGTFLLDLAERGHPQAEKLLDNLSQARLAHTDVLPFEDIAHGVQSFLPPPPTTEGGRS